MTQLPPEPPGEGTDSTPHARIGGVEYYWYIDHDQLVVLNASQERLDPTAARVMIALGGVEPPWYSTATALITAYSRFPSRGLEGVAAAAGSLSKGTTRRAQDARTTRDVVILAALAAIGTTEVGANENCDEFAWRLLMEHRDPAVASKALRNNEVLPATLINFPDVPTRERVARNPSCPVPFLDRLALEVPSVREAVALNRVTPPRLLDKLSRDDEWAVRRAVASNLGCPRVAAIRLLRDPILEVRVAAVGNPAVPRPLIARRILSDPTPGVHLAMAMRSDLEARDLRLLEMNSRGDPIPQYRMVCARLDRHPACTDQLRRRMTRNQERIAQLSPKALEKYHASHRKVPQVRPWFIISASIVISVLCLVGLMIGVGVNALTKGQVGAGVALIVMSVIALGLTGLGVHVWGVRTGRAYRRTLPRPAPLRTVYVLALVVSLELTRASRLALIPVAGLALGYFYFYWRDHRPRP